MTKPIAIAIHGGAGTILKTEMDAEKEARYRGALQAALHAGKEVLEGGGTALDAVEASVRSLEDCPLFNAGKGSVFTHEGTHEMDAAIMDGKTRLAGAVSLVSKVRNPVSLARLVMERTEHVFLSGPGAMDFAEEMQVPMETDEWFFDEYRYQQWQAVKDTDAFLLDHSQIAEAREALPTSVKESEENSFGQPLDEKKFGTVGAVALDQHGNIAAATSTGGMTNKKYGRIGDSPMIGAGNYANNETCAISATGSGEFFIRAVVAYDVSCLMEFKGLSLEEAAKEVVHHRLLTINGDGGLIGVDAQGNIAMPFNTEGMYRAAYYPDGREVVEIYG